MAEFKLVMSKKDGKSFQQIVKDKEASFLMKKSVGDKFSGNSIGMEGYEFEITGGSDKCGFPMRKGILQKRQRIIIAGEGVGSSGKDRNKKKQKGLKKKKTVCGERIDSNIVQINLKVLKEGKDKLGEEKTPESEEAPATDKVEETKEAPKEEEKPEEKEKDKPKPEAPKEEEKPKEESPKEEKAEEKKEESQ